MKDARAWLAGVLSGPATTGPYSADDRYRIAETLAGPKDCPYIEVIDDLAREYLAREALLNEPRKLHRAHRPRGTLLRGQLDKVSKQHDPDRFIAALDVLGAMRPSPWWSIYCRTTGRAKADLWPFIRASTIPDTTTSLKHARQIRRAAAEFCNTMPSSKTGRRQNILDAWFIFHLAAAYEVATGRRPSTRMAGFGDHAAERSGPFIRFVKACLDPIKEMPIGRIGEIAHATLRTRRGRKAA